MPVCPFCRLMLGGDETTCPRDGHAAEEARDAELPAELARRFTLVQRYAQGASGDLYLCDDGETGRRGILKVLRLPAKVTPAERARLGRELTKQATLRSSILLTPHLSASVLGTPWLFREWREGVSLRVRIKRDGALPVAEALAVTSRVASALDDLHRAGLLHRDLKAGHVLLNPRPSGVPDVSVIDAGVAGRIDVGSVFDVIGTPEYISPEQASGKLASFRSDLYALGCLLFEMLTGATPFVGEPKEVLERHRKEAPPTPSVSMPAGVAKLLGKLLAKEPRERPFSAQQVRRALEPFLPDGMPDDRVPTQSFAKLTEKRRSPLAGSGTLPPPSSPARTLMGMPATRPAGPTSAPPPPPGASRRSSRPPKPPRPDATEELSALDLAAAEVIVQSSKRPRADATEELSALDLAAAEVIAAPHRAPRVTKTLFGMPAARASAPPPTPSRPPDTPAASAVPEAPSASTPASAVPIAPSAAAPAAIPKPPRSNPGAFASATNPPSESAPAAIPKPPAPNAPAIGSEAPAPGAPATIPEAPTTPSPEPVSPGVIPPPASPRATAAGTPLPFAATMAAFPAPSALGASVAGASVAAARAPSASPPPSDPPTEKQPRLRAHTLQPEAAPPWEPSGGRSEAPTPAQTAPAQAAPAQAADPAVSAGLDLDYDDLPVTTAFDPESGAAPPAGLLGNLNDYSTSSSEAPAVAAEPAPSTAAAAMGPAPTPVAVPLPIEPVVVAERAERTPGALPISMIALALVAGFCLFATFGGAVLAYFSFSAPGGTTVSSADVTPTVAPAPSVQPTSTVLPSAAPSVALPNAEPEPQPVAEHEPVPELAVEPEPVPEPAVEPEPVPEPAVEPEPAHGSPPRAQPAANPRPHTARPPRSRAPAARTPPATPANAQNRMQRFQQLRTSAREHFTARRFAQAAEAYEEATRLNPRHAGSFAGLGAARAAQGQHRQAIRAYQNAVRLQPQRAGFHAALGHAYQQVGDRTRARQAFRAALQRDPSNRAAQRGLAAVGGR